MVLIVKKYCKIMYLSIHQIFRNPTDSLCFLKSSLGIGFVKGSTISHVLRCIPCLAFSFFCSQFFYIIEPRINMFHFPMILKIFCISYNSLTITINIHRLANMFYNTQVTKESLEPHSFLGSN